MASTIVHMAVAREVMKRINVGDGKSFLLGSIAPDVAKKIGEQKAYTHFMNMGSDLPNLDLFLDKYYEYLGNPFELGYFIHLVTDYAWFDDFIDVFYPNREIEHYDDMIYNDYSSLNREVMDYYNLNLSFLYEDQYLPVSHIKEVPTDEIPEVIDKVGYMVTYTANYHNQIGINQIVRFINYDVDYCLNELNKINYKIN